MPAVKVEHEGSSLSHSCPGVGRTLIFKWEIGSRDRSAELVDDCKGQTMTLEVFPKVYLMGCDFPVETGLGRNPSFRMYTSDRDSSLELRSSAAEGGVRNMWNHQKVWGSAKSKNFQRAGKTSWYSVTKSKDWWCEERMQRFSKIRVHGNLKFMAKGHLTKGGPGS